VGATRGRQVALVGCSHGGLLALPALPGTDYTPKQRRVSSDQRSPLRPIQAAAPSATVELFRGDGQGLARHQDAVRHRVVELLESRLRGGHGGGRAGP
jgi:hypothetical protein